MELDQHSNSITITGKKKSVDKQTEISYSYKVYFDSDNRLKALADLALVEELIGNRNIKNTNEQISSSYEPTVPRGNAI